MLRSLRMPSRLRRTDRRARSPRAQMAGCARREVGLGHRVSRRAGFRFARAGQSRGCGLPSGGCCANVTARKTRERRRARGTRNGRYSARADGLRPSRIPASGRVHPRITSAIDASRGRGRPLERPARERLEQGLGESLGDVRVHADAHAGALARAVSARAFTVGSDLFFAAGAYRPGSRDGDEFIATR